MRNSHRDRNIVNIEHNPVEQLFKEIKIYHSSKLQLGLKQMLAQSYAYNIEKDVRNTLRIS